MPRGRRALAVGTVPAVALGAAFALSGPEPGGPPPSAVCWDGAAPHTDFRTPSRSFVEGVRTADADHDGRAELQVFQSGGDGTLSGYVGRQEDGGVSVSRREVAVHAGDDDWRLPPMGWRDFGVCGS